MTDILLLAGGLILLVIGGELLVRGAVQAAERLGVSPLVIGLTLVGFGTSTPELVTSVQAALSGSPGIAVGNIVGSNIANILLILGLSALITPVVVATNALQRDGVFMVAVAALLVYVSMLTPLERWIGAGFIGLLVLYVVYAWRQEQAGAPDGHTAAFDKAQALETAHDSAEASLHGPKTGGILIPILLALGGLVVVVLGGKLLVDGAIGLARGFGISETVIGLTIVAVGTSMPEFVTSVIAALRKQSDVALGNILGSNIYNILGIGGVTALISPITVPPEMIRFDNHVMLAVSIMLLVFAATGLRIGRREGGLMLASYVGYVWVIWPK